MLDLYQGQEEACLLAPIQFIGDIGPDIIAKPKLHYKIIKRI